MATLPKHDTQTNRTVVLDFNGGLQVYRNPELGLIIPAQIEPGEFSAIRRAGLVSTLNREYASQGVRFTTDTAPGASAVHIGRTDAFDHFGRFLGLAEGIGSGDAFVLLDASANDAELADVICHEAGHILGTLDHGGAGLARYAALPDIVNTTYDHYNELDENGHYVYGSALCINSTIIDYYYEYETATSGEGKNIRVTQHPVYDKRVRYAYYVKANPDNDVYTSTIGPVNTYKVSSSASGVSVAGITVDAGSASGCICSSFLAVTSAQYFDMTFYTEPTSSQSALTRRASHSNVRRTEGSASGCVAYSGSVSAGTMTNCEIGAGGLSVCGVYNYEADYNWEGIGIVPAHPSLSYITYGKASNCTIRDGGTLTVEYGGTASDIIITEGNAVIGCRSDIASLPVDTETTHYSGGRNDELEDFAKVGSVAGKVTNLIVKDGSVAVNYGGELHNATVNGSMSVTEGGTVAGVITVSGFLNATAGANLNSAITCSGVNLVGVMPQANIMVKVDLRDYAVPNFSETLPDGTLVQYFANYTTKTIRYDENHKVISVTNGSFDNKDGRFNMKDWKYTFAVDIGKVDELSVGSVTVDFGGSEKDFDEGKINFFFPKSEDNIPFQLMSDKRRYTVTSAYFQGENDSIIEGASGLLYNSALFGDAADVLWLEFGENEDAEYTVDLSPVMIGATENLTITNADTENEILTDAKIQGATLVVKGGADTADLVVKAEDTGHRDHECDLELIVVPEAIPVLGKAGTKKYASMLKKMQKDRITQLNDILPYNIHTKFFGMAFDLTNMGISLTVNWTRPSMELKLQGKMEWAIGKGTAGTGRQLKLVVDLSGDNYVSITGTGGKQYSWDLVGEIKVPDFKIGKFEFSNMVLKVDKGNSAFAVSAYVKLPWIKYAFGGSIGIVDGYLDSMSIGVDSLNIPLGGTGLFLQKIEGGISGIATELNLTFEGTLGLTAGPKFKVEFVDWLGLDNGEYSLCEMTLTGSISTSGDLEGSSNCVILGGLATGGGSAGIKGGELFVTGNYTFLNGCISIEGELHAGKGGISIIGTGTATVPRERIFGPLAGLGMSANVAANVNHSASNSYVMAWQQVELLGNVFTIGFKSTFEGKVTLLGATDLLKEEDRSNLRSLKSVSTKKSISVAAPLLGVSEPSASKTITVNYSGISLFQFQLNEIGANVSLTFDGTEYTQAAIEAGLYDNMQVLSELSGDKHITIAVNNAQSGDWTMNAYDDANASFGVYSLEGGVQKPVIATITVGEEARSATITYALGDLSGLTDVQLSIYRTEKDTDYTGQRLAVIESPAADGSWEWVMEDELAGGDYSFYLMVESEGQTPVRSDISAAYTFCTLDLEAPDQIQTVNSEWSSSGTVVTWDESWDNLGIAGYKIRYAAGDGDMAEVNVKTNTFTFDKIPNGMYDFQIAAYDEAGNLSDWSEEQSVLVLTTVNAKYKDATLTEAIELAEYDSAVNITAGDFAVTAAANSLISGSVLADAGILGIVENTSFNGTVNLYDGAQGYGLTVNGELTVGGEKPVPEADITQTVWPDEDREEGGGEEEGKTESPAETPAQDEVVVIKKGTFADGITVKEGGKLTIEADAIVRNITVESGGSLALKDNAEFDQLTLAYGTSLIVVGSNNGTYRLSGDIYTAGTLSSYRTISGGGHKIHFEQYRQTAELLNSDTDYASDKIALLPDMDKLAGKAVDVVIDSKVYGSFKIADEAEHFNGTITVSDSVDGSSAEVGFDDLMLVGNALCKLRKDDDGGLWLTTVRSEIGTPTVTVENADNNAYDTIYLSTTPAGDSGSIRQYSYRYSLNADMSDSVMVETAAYTGDVSISKYDLVDNATYYVQASVENENGVKSLWSDAVSFTVVPKLLPDAPTTLTVTGATDKNHNYISFTATGVDDSNYTVREYRFRYADNPEMKNAVVITTGQRLINYASIDKANIEDGKDYYVQAGVKQLNDWSYWSDMVVFNTQGWDYENITIGPEPDGDFNYFTLGGKRAKDVTVIDGGYFYGGTGEVDGLTIEAGGFFRDDGATVTNAVMNGGEYWLSEGSVTDIVVNSGEFTVRNGTLNGATIGLNASMDLSSNYMPTITGTILIQGQFTIYYLHPGISTNAEFVFDVGAHEANKDKSFVEYIYALGGASKFTARLDDTPEIGEYRITSLYQVPEGELYVSLEANDGTKLGTLQVGGELIEYNGLYYSLIDQKGNAYLHVSDNQDPPFIGAVKLYKDGAVYDSNNGYSDFTVSATDECDYVLVGDAGQVSSITVGNGGSVDVNGIVFGATIENGGQLTLKEGGRALSNTITVKDGGNVTIEGGKVDLGAAFHLAGGTITVNGALQGWEDDSGNEWGATRHWFVYDLDKLSAAPSGVMISDYTMLQCNPEFTANMSANQKNVSYKLLGNASGFDSYVSLNVEGHDYQEYLRLGQECSIGDSYYSLAIVDNILTLNVSATRPVHAPYVWADVEEPTTGSVTVTASFDETAKTKEYSLDGVTWKTYKKAIKVTENGTIYFRGKDSKGNTSPVVSYEVTNIQKSGPEPGPGPDLPTDDDTANSWLYDKTKGVNEELRDSYGTTLEDGVSEVQMDTNSVSEVISGVTYSNFVGQGDEADFSKVVLDHGARLSFSLEATDAVKFVVYSLVEGTGKKAGTYTLKALQTTAFKPAKGADSAQKNTKQLSLDPGEYYISMQSTNAKKGGSAFYNVSINEDGTNGSVFYPQGNNEDDWTDMKTEGAGSAMLDDLGMVTPETTDLIDDWGGFGDTVDYKRFTLEHAAELDFAFGAPDGSVKFTVCKLKETTKKDVTTYSLINTKTATIKANQASARLNDLRLEAGEYFIKAEYTNAKKGNGTDYTVSIADSRFYSDGDSGDNNWLYDKKTKEVNVSVMDGFVSEIDTDHIGELLIDEPDTVIYDGIAGYEFHNFVGFGDEADYAKISVAHPGTATFKVTATDAAKLVVYQLTYNKKGEVSGTKAVQTVTLKKNAAGLFETPTNTKTCTFKQPGDYYISVQATAKKKETTYYNVSLVSTDIAAPLLVNQSAQDMCALTEPETDSFADSLVMSDSLSFGQYDTDALAGTYLDSVQDKLFGETGNGLLASL